MKLSIFPALFVLIPIQDVIAFKCVCSGIYLSGCNLDTMQCDAKSYCLTTWIVANGAVKDQGCMTTRTDLSENQCQTNRKGLVSCICNTENCNDASFSIPSDVVLTVPPVLKCFNKDLNEDDFCFGHYCTYSKEIVDNDFGDVYPGNPTASRGCSDSVCGSISCQCNTEFCNRDQPFPVPIGSVKCYTGSNSGNKYCRGHACYILPESKRRGCLSVSDGSPEELKKAGSYYGYQFCTEDLCNGEFTEDAIIETSTSA